MSKRTRSQNRDQLLKVFLECRTLIARVVGRVVKPHDIEDIVQETFIRSYEAIGRGTIRRPQSFMLRTAHNLALNHVRRADNRPKDRIEDLSSSNVYLMTETLESEFESRERFLIFCRAVRKLPVQCRRAFILKRVYGLSVKETARYLGLSESTVEKHIAKGLCMCRGYMETMERSIPATPHGDSKTRADNAS